MAPDRKLSGVVYAPRHREFYEMTVNNGNPITHWIVGAGRARWVQRYVFDPRLNENGRAPTHVGSTTVLGRPAIAYTFDERGGGIHSGHTLVVQRSGATMTFASVHGHGRPRKVEATRMLCGMLALAPRCRPTLRGQAGSGLPSAVPGP